MPARRINPRDFERPLSESRDGKRYFKKTGRPEKLTPTQRLEVRAWMKARTVVRALGSPKKKAAELGISETTLRRYMRLCGRVAVAADDKFYRLLKELAF